MPKEMTPGTTAADRRKAAAADRESNPTKKYRVRAGQSVTVGEDRDGDTVMVQYGPGEEVALTEEQAKSMPWAIDLGERRRPGQTSRMKQRMQELEAENKRLREEAKARTKKDDKGREAARESLMARGDNFIGRGEPELGKVPQEVVDAHDRRLMESEFGFGAELESDDELAGGMHGVARETSGASSGKTGATGAQAGQTGPGVASSSSPSNLEPGQSQRPGETEPRGDKQQGGDK